MLSRKKIRIDLDYSRRVKELRLALSLTQHAFAELLHVRPQVVASWEQGRREPSAKSYQQLARLAPAGQAAFFLARMGMTPELVQKLLPEAGAVPPEIRMGATEEGKTRVSERLQYQVQIPVLRNEAAVRSPGQVSERDIDCFIAIPNKAAPKGPGAYAGVYIHGDSMEPILRDRFIVVVDYTRNDPVALRGRLVAVQVPGAVLVKLLARESEPNRLILRSYNPEYADVVLESLETNPVIGDVVFWWGVQEG
jgi:phage repressor protein C with HTH and peptisase S24 domain